MTDKDGKCGLMAMREIPFERYLGAGQMGARICFSCRAISEPRPPVDGDDTEANERRCGECGEAAAVELDRAVREGWLTVVNQPRVSHKVRSDVPECETRATKAVAACGSGRPYRSREVQS